MRYSKSTLKQGDKNPAKEFTYLTPESLCGFLELVHFVLEV